MRFYEFGGRGSPIVVLIHGVLTPWQIWEEQINYFKSRYLVIVPALDAHTEEEPSEYISADAEAEKICEYIISNHGNDVFLLAGLSLGGVIANKIYESRKLNICKIVFDGAPLVRMPSFMEKIMVSNYLSIIHGAQKREDKVLYNFAKHFLPEKYLQSFLSFADTMSDESVVNIVKSACRCEMKKALESDVEIVFLHGTKLNEMYAKKSAKIMKKTYNNVTVKAFNGYAHGELAIYHPDEWCDVVSGLIIKRGITEL